MIAILTPGFESFISTFSALLLLLAGDVETNPGPGTCSPYRYSAGWVLRGELGLFLPTNFPYVVVFVSGVPSTCTPFLHDIVLIFKRHKFSFFVRLLYTYIHRNRLYIKTTIDIIIDVGEPT